MEHNWSYWKRQAKIVFQKYIRLRDSNNQGFCFCASCGRAGHWKKMNGGHFIPAERLATCFVEQNCHAQCVYCNKGLGGNVHEYRKFMVKRYGKETVESLENQKHLNIKYTMYDFKAIIILYDQKIDEMKARKGLV